MSQNQEKNNGSVMPDVDIIELYWQRQERAISETDKKYGKYLFTIAYNIVHDKLDSEECVNDTYLGTWNAIPPARPGVFQMFLAKIMRGVAIDRFRANSAAKRISSEMMVSLEELDECISYECTVEQEQEQMEIARLLNSFLRALNERAQFIFVCRYYYADSIAGIAKMLSVSENTVYRELADMRRNLRQILEKEGYFRA